MITDENHKKILDKVRTGIDCEAAIGEVMKCAAIAEGHRPKEFGHQNARLHPEEVAEIKEELLKLYAKSQCWRTVAMESKMTVNRLWHFMRRYGVREEATRLGLRP